MSITSRSLRLDVRWLSLHARVCGELSSPVVILLHGWLDHSGSHDRLVEALHSQAAASGEALCTVALDFRGHGDSAWVGAGGFYHLVEYVADLDGALVAVE